MRLQFCGRFTYEKETFVAYIRAALLRQVEKDNVIYHGLAGHFLLKDLPHVLKVRIIADMEERVREEMKRENISAEEARRILQKDDGERRKWSKHVYGIDTWDPSLYDLVIDIKCISVDGAVDIIRCALEGPLLSDHPRRPEAGGGDGPGSPDRGIPDRGYPLNPGGGQGGRGLHLPQKGPMQRPGTHFPDQAPGC